MGVFLVSDAAELAAQGLDSEATQLAKLSLLMFACLSERLPGLSANGSQVHEVPGALHLSSPEVQGEEMQQAIRSRVEVSVGSACATGHTGPSAVMVAMGVPDERAMSSVRFTLGRFTTEDDVHFAMDAVVHAVKKLRVTSSRFAKTR
ncbi:MAG: cysteine desulfurase [Candidatus Krumholzibacteriia bacterium]